MKAKTAKKPTGRPSIFTQKVADAICARLPFADGGLEEICSDPEMPHESTVYRWLSDPERADFREAYARARELAGDVQAARGLRDALQAGDAALGRLKFDARKWVAAKLKPRVYGDKVAVTGGDPDQGDKPVQHTLTVEFVRAGPNT